MQGWDFRWHEWHYFFVCLNLNRLETLKCVSGTLRDRLTCAADDRLRPGFSSAVLFTQLSQQSAVQWTCPSDNLCSPDEVFNWRRTTYPLRWMMTLNCSLASCLPCIFVSPQASLSGCWLPASAAMWGFFPGTAPAQSVLAALVNERPVWVGVCLNGLWHISAEHRHIFNSIPKRILLKTTFFFMFFS